MALSVGALGSLHHLNLKINTDQRGYNLKFHIMGADYAAVTPKGVAIAVALKKVLPTDAEIFYATISNDNSRRDSVFLRTALGPGLYAQTGTPPPAKPFDNSHSCLLVRFENNNGGFAIRKINPIPDDVMTGGALITGVADVTGPVTAAPAVSVGTDAYEVAFNLFMKSVMFNSVYVQAGHGPGGAWNFDVWQNAYVLRQGIKKGGRVFVS